MTTSTSILRHEHDAILKMLEATEEVARLLSSGAAVKPETLSGLLEFFQLFADKCHHGKEEALLFPLLEERGIPREGGPVGCMLMEHTQGRALIARMAAAAQAFTKGVPSPGKEWAEAARDYAALLRAHIDKENNILFVMADRVLSLADQESLVQAFEKVENEKMGPGTHERLHASMDRLLAEIFRPAPAHP